MKIIIFNKLSYIPCIGNLSLQSNHLRLYIVIFRNFFLVYLIQIIFGCSFTVLSLNLLLLIQSPVMGTFSVMFLSLLFSLQDLRL